MKDSIAHTGRGMAVGVADLVPGVSGATIALILGIYEKLIFEISGLLKRPRRFADLKANLTRDWTFLILTGIGIGISVFLGSLIIPQLVRDHPLIIFSIFSGLIASSAFVLARTIHGTRTQMLWIVLGAIIGAGVAIVPVGIEANVSTWGIMLAGTLAICAMLIPGISGSYVLLLIGYYTHLLGAIRGFDIGFLLLFASGGIVGAMIAIFGISRLLKTHHTATMLVLIGLIGGALGRPLGIAVGSVNVVLDWIVLIACVIAGIALTALVMHGAQKKP